MAAARLSRDQLVACALAPVILLVLAVLYVVVVALQGRPFLHVSERMADADRSFPLYKIRTMRRSPSGREGALGGADLYRVTPIGRILRRTRLDELPQIFNVIRGDIGFIGPRPPLPVHVAAHPEGFRRLLEAVRPGITGLATVTVHRREERLLSGCRTAAETEEVYLRRCLPVKLRLDAIYARNRCLSLDLLILWRTFARLMPVPPRDRAMPGDRPAVVRSRVSGARSRWLPASS